MTCQLTYDKVEARGKRMRTWIAAPAKVTICSTRRSYSKASTVHLALQLVSDGLRGGDQAAGCSGEDDGGPRGWRGRGRRRELERISQPPREHAGGQAARKV